MCSMLTGGSDTGSAVSSTGGDPNLALSERLLQGDVLIEPTEDADEFEFGGDELWAVGFLGPSRGRSDEVGEFVQQLSLIHI